MNRTLETIYIVRLHVMSHNMICYLLISYIMFKGMKLIIGNTESY